MTNDKSISDHYTHGDLVNSIQKALLSIEKTPESVTLADLAPVDEFHIGGRLATDHLLKQVDFSRTKSILDIGCGLGGASRYIANKYDIHVTGIDLTQDYIQTGNVLSNWLGLERKVELIHGSALSMPFDDEQFDGGYMLHVGMNIEDKASLFTEIKRVLKPNSIFAIYDIMRQNDEDLVYPVPWASGPITSYLSTPEEYIESLERAGFKLKKQCNRSAFALKFFKSLKEKNLQNRAPPSIGLHLLMQQSTTLKIENMIDNIRRACIAPVEIVAHT